MQHKRSHRIVFYLNDVEAERLDKPFPLRTLTEPITCARCC